jgi:hypothetical protein
MPVISVQISFSGGASPVFAMRTDDLPGNRRIDTPELSKWSVALRPIRLTELDICPLLLSVDH